MAVNREPSGTESPTPSGERAAAIELIATRITAASGAVASMLAAGKLYPQARSPSETAQHTAALAKGGRCLGSRADPCDDHSAGMPPSGCVELPGDEHGHRGDPP